MKTYYVLSISIWDADDFLNNRNCDPISTDFYLYKTKEEAKEMAKNLEVSEKFYNDGMIYTGELDDDEILEISGFDTIDDFNEALKEPYSTNQNVKNFGEKEKSLVAHEIIENSLEEEIVECANFDFDESLEGCILVFWYWEKYVGYARKCIDVRKAFSDDTFKILTKSDKTFITQCDILLTSEEVEKADNLCDAIQEALLKSSWKWQNTDFVKSIINDLNV